MEANRQSTNTAIFFCQQLDPDQDANRRPLEKELGGRIRFFPLPCSGRIDVLHLLKALETGAEKVYLITCPEGACRYRQGNVRAGKRLDYAKSLIREIGMDAGCLELVRAPDTLPLSIDGFVRNLLGLAPAKDPAPQGRPAGVPGSLDDRAKRSEP